MELGFIGLGRMGGNMVQRLLERGGHQVIAYDPSPEAGARAREAGARIAGSLSDLMAALQPPRVLWLMVPAGAPVDATYAQLAALAAPGDVFVDGGNSHYKDSQRRAAQYAERGIEVMDVGTSGGVWGRENGYCMMIGGTPAGFSRIEPALATLAPEKGYLHVGRSGAGHFSKMVHNGIEYGMMQAYAEGFALLQAAGFGANLQPLAQVWNQGSVIRSWLLELAANALGQDPKLESVAPYVEDTGEGRWTVEAAIEHAVPMPVIAESLFARFRSRQSNSFADRFLAVLRKQFGGHATRPKQP